MKRRTLLGTLGATLAASLAGCGSVFDDSSYRNGEYILCRGGNEPGRIGYDCDSFDGATGRYFRAEAGERIEMTYLADLRAGALHFVLFGPDDTIRWDRSCDHTRRESGTETVAAETPGRYHVRVEGHDVKGQFEVTWDRS